MNEQAQMLYKAIAEAENRAEGWRAVAGLLAWFLLLVIAGHFNWI
jgi:hypothetical protein